MRTAAVIPASIAKTSGSNTRSPEERNLRDIRGIGRSILRDLSALGIRRVSELADSDGDDLYRRLCEYTGQRQDPCVLDTFRCAVAQARDPLLDAEKCNWWWWSRQRKLGKLPS